MKQQRKQVKRKVEALQDAAPALTEQDLLAFQISHFGDDSKPANWFVDAQTAETYEPEADDGLGYYADGVKRTLTDENIEFFRNLEIRQLIRKGKLKREELEEAGKNDASQRDPGGQSPVSDVSSLEEELLGLSNVTDVPHSEVATEGANTQDQRNSDEALRTTLPARREQEIPYDQRHKRQWEQYIHDYDADEGSLTHRRVARDLDERPPESFELDY